MKRRSRAEFRVLRVSLSAQAWEYPSVPLSVCPSVPLSVLLSVCLSVLLSVCLSA